jgi:hypothetical protein
MDVIETLQHPDAAFVGFGREPVKHCDVLLELRGREFLRFRVFRKFEERGERVAIPEIERVNVFVGELIEILCPGSLVVEPGEVLRGIAVVVLGAFVGDLGLLQADGDPAQLELRVIFDVERCGDCVLLLNEVDEIERTVEDAGRVKAGDDDGVGVGDPAQQEGFLGVGPEVGDGFVVAGEKGVVARGEENALVAGKMGDGGFEALGGESLAWGRMCGMYDMWGCEGGGAGKRENEKGESRTRFGFQIGAHGLRKNHPGSLAGTCGSSAGLAFPFASEIFWKRTAW